MWKDKMKVFWSVLLAIVLTLIITVPSFTQVIGSGAKFIFDTVTGGLKVHLSTCISGESACDGTDGTSTMRTIPTARVGQGATSLPYISVGTSEDKHAVCTAPCTLYWISATNTNAAVRYLKCENDTAANTAPGTDTPELRFAIPGATTGAGNNPVNGGVGLKFTTALTCWMVTGAADSDVAEVAANELMVNYGFKE